jgi:murein DD-endopeptidase MepM/ murein hydrolase activator NlpD
MNIVFFSPRDGRARHVNLAHPLTLGALGLVVAGILSTAFVLGLQLGQRSGASLGPEGSPLGRAVAEHQAQIDDLRNLLQDRVDALALRVGQVNAHVVRLDALGKRLTDMANLDHREFNFDAAPAVGGPEDPASTDAAAAIPELTTMIDALEERVSLRDGQMAALENVLLARQLRDEIRPDGRPVKKGFISSYFGERQDPFTGHEAFHKGVDFAGSAGAEVIAVAAGVVTWAGERVGFGYMVEINHGDGFVTRYAHNTRNAVQVGATVTRGQTIAYMGSTGRSTGPHVHFEVLRNGRQVDPLTFIGR